jgi:hypothetical protein
MSNGTATIVIDSPTPARLADVIDYMSEHGAEMSSETAFGTCPTTGTPWAEMFFAWEGEPDAAFELADVPHVEVIDSAITYPDPWE